MDGMHPILLPFVPGIANIILGTLWKGLCNNGGIAMTAGLFAPLTRCEWSTMLGYHKKAPANAGPLSLFETSHLRTSSGGWFQIKKNLPPGGFFFVIPAGFKPTTSRSGIWRSIQLNYGTGFFAIIINKPESDAPGKKSVITKRKFKKFMITSFYNKLIQIL